MLECHLNDIPSLVTRIGYKDCSFHLGHLSHSLACSLACSMREAILHAVSCLMERHCGKKLRRALDNSYHESESLTPTAFEELNPATNYVSELGRSFRPSES